MPFVGWYDAGTGQKRPFGSELEWTECPVGPELLVELRNKAVATEKRRVEREAAQAAEGVVLLSPSRLTATPRQYLVEKYLDCWLDPEEMAGLHLSTILHAALTSRAAEFGYLAETELRGKIGPFEVVGVPDAHWSPASRGSMEAIPRALLNEYKQTTSGSVKFLVQDGRAKDDHVTTVNIYRHLMAQTYDGYNAEEIPAVIRYYAMPQKERFSSGWERTPPVAAFTVPFMSVDAILDSVPGYSPPKNDRGYQGPPPGTVRENGEVIVAAVMAIRAGADPKEVIARTMCQCDRRFNGQGRTYCGVRRTCAMEDHGTPMW